MAPRKASADAEIVALEALAFLAASPRDLAAFVALSGIDPAAIPAHARERHFLAGVLDFFLHADSLLGRFCESQSIAPRTIHDLRASLSGAAADVR